MFHSLIMFFLITSSALKAESYQLKIKAYIDVEKGMTVESMNFVTIENGLIKEIGTKRIKTLPLKDYGNDYLIPGLFDCHTHLFLTQTPDDNQLPEAEIRESKSTAKSRTERAQKYLAQYLSQGFTAVCDLGNSGNFLDAKLKKKLFKNLNFPQMFVSGPALATGFAQYRKGTPLSVMSKEFTMLNRQTDIEQVLQNYLDQGVDILKIILDGANPDDNFDEVILEKILTSKKLSQFKKVTVHATNKFSFDMIKKYKLIHAEHLSFFSDEKLPLHFLTNTIINKDVLLKHHFFSPIQSAAQKRLVQYALKKNIKMIFGPDFYYQTRDPLYNRAADVIVSAQTMQEYGMSALEVLQSMTINPAESLGLQSQMGNVKVGALADLVLIDSNPLQNIKALYSPKAVIRGGHLISLKKTHR